MHSRAPPGVLPYTQPFPRPGRAALSSPTVRVNLLWQRRKPVSAYHDSSRRAHRADDLRAPS